MKKAIRLDDTDLQALLDLLDEHIAIGGESVDGEDGLVRSVAMPVVSPMIARGWSENKRRLER